MRIGILRIGTVEPYVLSRIKEGLSNIFPETKCTLIGDELPVLEEAFNENRRQYDSTIILHVVHSYAERKKIFNRILGVTEVDLFVPRLNFVFGEAECPGRVAIISLHRLRPEFYGEKPNLEVFVERCLKEAVHELGHTLGLRHCPNPFCVMHFSNSIFDTDTKQSLFCNKCYLKVNDLLKKLE
ncbi:archemetzincin [Candidatus Bathyarchaeota archaeon]|nr:MAG: archemetzincin [Candidatus Bathyarchaeota archaeon]